MFTRSTGSGASARVALVSARARGGAATAARRPFSLVVDLSAEPVGGRWARGAATLALLCGAALSLAPAIDPFSSASAHTFPAQQQFQLNPMLSAGAAGAVAAAPIDSQAAPLPLAKPVIASGPGAIRVQGPVTEGLYWSLRAAGVSPDIAADYLKALSSRVDVGVVAPFDSFDLVIAREPKPGARPLLYAALHRADGPDVELMKWTVSGRTDWFDTEASGQDRSAALMSPVAGRITSGFGTRRHPILRFARFHSGIDFGASRGSPIVAAADGVVIGTGWNGGYGRQVQVAHGSGIVTTYSHMSGFAASAGQTVMQGQVIGYVGSTGLSTGPHLHFEVRLNGRAVNPLEVQLQRRQVISGAERQAFNARLKQLMAIGRKAA